MATRIVVGAQWGDEGKGKMVDYLAQNADLIVRYQGGDNAGHTVVNDKGVFKLHLIPCGIFYDRCAALAGTGMVALSLIKSFELSTPLDSTSAISLSSSSGLPTMPVPARAAHLS